MNKELKNNIIIAALTASLTATGFIGKDYFEKRNKQDQYIGEIHKKLYDKGAEELEKVKSTYSDLHSLLSTNYALTTYELGSFYEKFVSAIEDYQKYISELERYGNTGQVQVAKNLNTWILGLNADFNLQYKSAEQIQLRTKELLLVEDPNSDLFKFVNDALESELDRFMQNENRIFYETGRYKRPIISGLEQYLNHQFRAALGLDTTIDMAKTINELPELAKRNPAQEYKDKKLPYMFAESRVFQAPTLEFSGVDDIFVQKNAALRAQVKMKFIAKVIENDRELQEILKKRKSNSTPNRG